MPLQSGRQNTANIYLERKILTSGKIGGRYLEGSTHAIDYVTRSCIVPLKLRGLTPSRLLKITEPLEARTRPVEQRIAWTSTIVEPFHGFG